MSASRILKRSLVLAALLVLAGVLAAPLLSHAPAHSPYVSALNKLTAPSANASSCPFQKCHARNSQGYVCIHANTASECLISGSSCNTQSCLIQ